MNHSNTSSAVPLLPPCARLAAVCTVIEGKETTCPVAMQRACPAHDAIRNMVAHVAAPSAQ